MPSPSSVAAISAASKSVSTAPSSAVGASSYVSMALYAGLAVLAVLVLIFLYKKFIEKKPKPKHEYFENDNVADAEDTEVEEESLPLPEHLTHAAH